MVDEHDQPIAGAVVLIWIARPAGAPGTLAAGTAGDRARPRSGHLTLMPVATALAPSPVEPAPPTEGRLRVGGAIAADRTGADGRFSLPILPPGRYVIFALSLGPPPATSELLVVDDGFLLAPLRLVIERRPTPLI